MSDALLWAERLGDGLSHTSVMADILGGVLEVAANVAITALATAAVVIKGINRQGISLQNDSPERVYHTQHPGPAGWREGLDHFLL